MVQTLLNNPFRAQELSKALEQNDATKFDVLVKIMREEHQSFSKEASLASHHLSEMKGQSELTDNPQVIREVSGTQFKINSEVKSSISKDRFGLGNSVKQPEKALEKELS